METDEALAYLIALSVPVWLLLEHGINWLRSRRQHGSETAAPAQAVSHDRPEVSRKAA